jgi:hypothetical protein
MVLVTPKAEGIEAHKGSDAMISVMKPALSSAIGATGIRHLNER